MVIDVNVMNPLRLDLAARSVEEPGNGMSSTNGSECSKYREKFETEGINFCPFVVDIFGGMHDRVCIFTKRLGQSLERATGRIDSELVSHIFQKLSSILH